MYIFRFISVLAISIFVLMGEIFAQEKPKRLDLKAYTKIDKDYTKETSGIVQSKKYPGVFWVLDDSGNKDMIFAIDKDGNSASGDKKYKGQKVKGANNRDWEDILVDDEGHIIIADIGNNCECRDNLRFYYLNESDPGEEKNEVVKEIRFKYPKTKTLLGLIASDFNAEASFFVRDHVYILTKHGHMFGKTKLYRLDDPKEDVVNELTYIDEYAIDGSVTGADTNADGTKLAVLTYNSVWVFDIEEGKELLEGQAYHRKIKAHQVESIAFYQDSLIIVDEKEGRMYEIELSELTKIDK